ncbi:hypothetical protein O7626_28380 [Micromonospora sp. WMMD1102]|uniref:hypothetical protein n=1 Tax=Micromonospora sp. WMMD1102 TaxID=3016105 RepID=UPI0024154681|nr:hypothetical protein [Micromonospora sp. WMMD1102]MDG4789797.1 hypothetical protein [Micromonospora sp. WMMD1102]
MQRARRLASIAVIAVLGSTVLSACRSDSNVAVYLGDKKITEDEVTSVLDDVRSKASPAAEPAAIEQAGATPAPDAPEPKTPSRAEVVGTLVMREVCLKLAADKGFKPSEQAPVERVAEATGLPANSRYVQLFSELDACRAGIPVTQPVAPTKEELLDVVTRGRAAGVIPPDAKDGEAGQQLDGDVLRRALAMRNVLTEALESTDVTVNPRYRPLEYPVLTFSDSSPALVVPIGPAGSDTVIDAR